MNATSAAPVLLPERLRLPDLTLVRTFAAQDLDRWLGLAGEALRWGPDERNGCHRVIDCGYPMWRNAAGRAHSPDPWTPALGKVSVFEWHRDAEQHSTPERPSLLTAEGMQWRAGWRRHRAHAPAVLDLDIGHRMWCWQDQWPSLNLGLLLEAAWLDQELRDQDARALLNSAAGLGQDPSAKVAAPVWLGHVIAAHPSPNLTAGTRAWARLLTT